MSNRTSTAQNGPDPRAQTLVGSYVRAGYVQIDPSAEWPANLHLRPPSEWPKLPEIASGTTGSKQ